MDLFAKLHKKSGTKLKTVILPESYDERVIEAAKVILKNKKTGKIVERVME